MLRQKTIGFILLLLCSLTLNAQSWDEIKQDKEWLKGEGMGSTLEEADQKALTALISQISLQVSHQFEQLEDEKTVGGSIDSETYISNKLSTFSNASLKDVPRFPLKSEPGDYHVARCIKRSELDRIFNGRKETVKHYVGYGMSYERDLKIGDALKNYFWAYSLLKTLPYPNEEKMWDYNANVNRQLTVWLPAQIDNILSDIRINVTNFDDNEIDLGFTYNNQPIVSLDFSYYNGTDWEPISEVKDGRGVVYLDSSNELKELRVKVEYKYLDDVLNGDPEMASVLNVVKGNDIRKAYQRIPLNKKALAQTPDAPIDNNAAVNNATEMTNTGIIDDTPTGSAVTELADDFTYRSMMDDVINSVRTGDYESARYCFTDEGYEIFLDLMSYGKARIYGDPEYKIYQHDSKTVIRSIPMTFAFKKGARKTIVEDVVFVFDGEDKIENLSLALNQSAADSILSQGFWPESAKMTLLEFMENYKTAYCLKRLSYIQQVFSDDALIIVGNVVKRLDHELKDDQDRYASHTIVKRTRYSKQQYVKHLAACFARNECINIHFADSDVIKAGKGGEVYGIQIKQDYYSTTYGDSGYLFIAVDLNDPDEPIIMVRTWQEKPDPVDGLYSLYDFD